MTYLGYKTTPHGCPYCLEPTEYEKYDWDRSRHTKTDGEGTCPKCEETFKDEEMVTVHKEKRWKMQMIYLNEMAVKHEEKYNDQQLIRLMLDNSDIWKEVIKLEDAGLKFRFEIDEIVDYHGFVKAWIQSKEWYVTQNKYGYKGGVLDYDIVDCQSVPASGGSGTTGHPDFKIQPNEEALKEIEDTSEVGPIFIEFKYGNDKMSNTQFEWFLDAIKRGESCFLMRVMNLDS